jgi:hypothetical protein
MLDHPQGPILAPAATPGGPCLAVLVPVILLALLLPAPGLASPAAGQAPAHDMPAWLPHYDVDIDLDVAGHQAHVRQRATWTNMHPSASTKDLVFNAHSRYIVPDKEIGFMAKMLEILRVKASEALGEKVPACDIRRITLPTPTGEIELPFHYEGDTLTSLVVNLPAEVKPGQSITVVMDFVMHLPHKQGRWGQWEGVTFLSNWLPVFAVFADPIPPPGCPHDKETPHPPPPSGPTWQPTPFVPWHQPFFNEACIYTVRVRLPADQHIATSGTIMASGPIGEGRQEVHIQALGVRDFAFLCSARYHSFDGEVKVGPDQRPVRIHILAFPEHEFYARQMVRIACQAITIYSQWFGPYPWDDFTIAEAFFGWNGNECATLVMIDERVFAMPHLACGYADYLVSHEICHQWWYNLVGTNGYCETWMDEAFANHFSHRLLNQVVGKNNQLMHYPAGLEWLPNIRREDYRSYGLYGTFGRGENGPILQEMPKFGHLANLFSLCYDKGSRVVGMIEERLGEAAFMDFIRRVQARYRYRIIRVADFQRELEEYTGRSWQDFFCHWLYGLGLSDWSIEKVEVTPEEAGKGSGWAKWACPLARRLYGGGGCAGSCEPHTYRVVVWVKQKLDYNEPTTLGFALPNCLGYPIRVPILPDARSYQYDDPPTRVEALHQSGGAYLRVEVVLPAAPTQIAVDPDQLIVDTNPANNFWHTPIRWRVTPVYTFLEETDLTCAYDRWNVIAGPWIYGAAYDDAWFTRSTMIGARAALYRTQEFCGGIYSAYRTDFRDVVLGADGVWDHWPDHPFQTGFNVERRLAGTYDDNEHAIRAAVWERYVLTYGSSLYLPPFQFVDAYASYQDNFLPFADHPSPLAQRPERTSTLGLRYHLNYLTPYFDPEGGMQFDLYYEGGLADLDRRMGMQKFSGQFSMVKSLPDLSKHLPAGSWLHESLGPALEWLGDTRLAWRIYGGVAGPSYGEFFSMGGSQLFRGFDLAQRQGSTVWVGSLEWRVPLAQNLHTDALDHIFSLRNVYGAAFYDVGDALINNHSQGPVAHAAGLGLRFDVSYFSFVERTLLTVDVAKTVNLPTGVQVWFGVTQPF